MYLNKVLIFCLILVKIKSEITKTSLTFVIDDTGSMGDDIDQVKYEVNAIFDTHLKSNDSQIGNFIIVTFNDPGVKLRTITTDRMTFRKTLDNIDVDGGGDCAEMSMSGIKAAIDASLPRSSLYVFTDAAAKDFEKGTEVARMAQDKNCQVDFVLTGMCGGPTELDYLVYHSVANKTNGQVFHMNKRDIHKILKYVEHNIKGQGTVLAKTRLPAGTSLLPPITVDAHNKDVTVAVSGGKSSIDVRDSDDKKAPTETIVHLPESTVEKVRDPKPGVYNVSITAAAPVSVLVTARTDFHFDHGFSFDGSMSTATVRPVAVCRAGTSSGPRSETGRMWTKTNDITITTSSTPSPLRESPNAPVQPVKCFYSVKYHLWIKLNGDSKNIDVKTVDISDMAGNVLVSLEMTSTSEPGIFEVLTNFVVPKETFNIDIKAIDTNTKEKLSRRSKTPITPQDPSVETIKTFKPIVKIIGGPKIFLEGEETLSCEVKAYPTPVIAWQDLTTSDILPSKTTSESLFDHISILAVTKTINYAKYRCIATNTKGENSADIEVERKPYFSVVEKPLDTKIEHKNQGRLTCKADSYPPSTVTWIHARKNLHNDTKIEISEDGSQLTIKYMDMSTRGYFICEIRNEGNRRIFKANVDITGAAPPRISKEPSKIRAIQNTTVVIPCNVISGEPKPNLLWFYRRTNKETYTPYNNYNGSDLRIEELSESNSGYYLCAARNEWGYDMGTRKLVVEYPPEIAEEDEAKIAKSTETVRLMCSVEGVPKPRVSWSLNGRSLTEDMGYRILRDNSLIFSSTTNNSGDYICEAVNNFGKVKRKVSLVVHVPIQMPSPRSPQDVLVGGDLKLPCVANGYPTPKKHWWFWSGDGAVKPLPLHPSFADASGTLLLNNIQSERQGYYFCVAKNSVETKNITYFVRVNVPPKIQNYPDKVFTAVVGDLVLLIPCRATGTPKPVITWKFNDELVPTDSPWYDISPEGTLSIRNIVKDSAGTYTCLANNSLNYDSETFEVVVESYPKRTVVISNVTLKAGSKGVVPCGIPHKSTDVITWFKNGLQIARGELKLPKVSRSDSGIYTCRVSTLYGAKSAEVQINVGSPPEFEIDKEEIYVNGSDKSYLALDCSNAGDPVPKVTWWFQGTKLRSMDDKQIIEFRAQPSDSGVYFCIAENVYGKKFKRFNVKVAVDLSEVDLK